MEFWGKKHFAVGSYRRGWPGWWWWQQAVDTRASTLVGITLVHLVPLII